MLKRIVTTALFRSSLLGEVAYATQLAPAGVVFRTLCSSYVLAGDCRRIVGKRPAFRFLLNWEMWP